MSSIELDSVVKRFDDVVAVNGVDLSVREGEFIVFVGPSGCGKSTTLRLVAGLETPTEGTIKIGGEDVTNVEPKNRDVAMVFQNYALYPHMSARRNMTFGAKSNADEPLSDEEIDRRVEDAAGILDIADLLDRKPAELSGGEQQRVAMGRALIRDPSVMLLDEPLSNLDAKLRDHMRAELSELHDKLEMTVVYVTHDQTEAMTLGERVAVMDGGRLQQIDHPQKIFNYPATRFVAEFIGSPQMNIMPAQLTRQGDTILADAGEFDLEIANDDALANYFDRSVSIGIRPLDLHLAERFDREHRSREFQATVDLVETLGDAKVIHADIGEQRLRVQTAPDVTCSKGDTITIVADTHRVHVFDDDTGKTVHHSDPDFVDASTQALQTAEV